MSDVKSSLCCPYCNRPMDKQSLRKWRYEEDDRPLADCTAACYDCGLSYDGGDGWCDVVIPNEIWELINPTHDRGCGLLCFNCIARRLAFIGLEDVPVFIVSGPFRNNEPTKKETKKYFGNYDYEKESE